MNVNRFVNSVVAIALVFAIGWLVEGIWREQCGKWGAENRLPAEQAAAQRAREAELAARPRMPSHPELHREPEGSMSQGPTPCLACSDLGGGTDSWSISADGTNPATASTNGFASGPTPISGTARFTMGTNNFSLGSDAVGVLVQIKWNQTGTGPVTDATVRLTYNGAPIGENKATNSSLPTTSSFSSYGGSSDNWAAPLTTAVVNDPSFGVDIVVSEPNFGDAANIAEVDITVYDSGGGGGNPIKLKCGGVVGAWVNPENALLEDGAYATNSLPLGNGVPLDGTMEGNHFSVASDQHIWKVLVRVLCMADAPVSVSA